MLSDHQSDHKHTWTTRLEAVCVCVHVCVKEGGEEGRVEMVETTKRLNLVLAGSSPLFSVMVFQRAIC